MSSMYITTSDSYSSTPALVDDVDHWLDECEECFGERPTLVEREDSWDDENGPVLERVEKCDEGWRSFVTGEILHPM
jgi:hypothetical protein